MEMEISIRLNRIPLTRLDPTRRSFPSNRVTRSEFTTSPRSIVYPGSIVPGDDVTAPNSHPPPNI
ncbi:hypothetical protein TIFTF001_030831 [Ficus carica]|uniref:Uncharacterized protein n=1 Tax=Ficus carica TaxID=3494 RepID=A0AA88DV50_FICCA|nr:hypothetical protein TIFTF001_030831 [Ficus carica]